MSHPILVPDIAIEIDLEEISSKNFYFASTNLGFKILQTNYTATGFITKKVKEIKVIKEEEPKEVKQEE